MISFFLYYVFLASHVRQHVYFLTMGIMIPAACIKSQHCLIFRVIFSAWVSGLPSLSRFQFSLFVFYSILQSTYSFFLRACLSVSQHSAKIRSKYFQQWIEFQKYLRSYNYFLRCLSFRIFAAATDVQMQIIFNRCVKALLVGGRFPGLTPGV